MKKKRGGLLIMATLGFLLALGCQTQHKIDVAVNKPIKVEARIDIYLHANTIENMVKGNVPLPEVNEKSEYRQSFWRVPNLWGIKKAYAEEIPFKSITPEIRVALENRKNRYSKIQTLIDRSCVKEGPSGYLVSTGPLSQGEAVLLSQENKDRKFIYEELAEQNNLSLAEVEKAFAKVHAGK